MARHVRSYLFGEKGMRPLRVTLMVRLHGGEAALPEYAGTTQRIAEVIVEYADRKPQRIILARGHYYAFDQNGYRIPNRGPHENWTLTDDQIEQISAHLWKRTRGRR
jgi:hypothetical protein